MRDNIIDEIKLIIENNKNNDPGMVINVLSETFSIDIIDEEKEEVITIYEIKLKELFNKIFNNKLELDWF